MRMFAAIGIPLIGVALWWWWPESNPEAGDDALGLEGSRPGLMLDDAALSDPLARPEDAVGQSGMQRATQTRPEGADALSTVAASPEQARPATDSEADGPPTTLARGAGDAEVESAAATDVPPLIAGATRGSSAVRRLLLEAETAQAASRLLDARLALNRALHHPEATEPERAMLRSRLTELNETMVFSRAVIPGDPLIETYTIRSGDSLSKVVGDHDLGADWRLVLRVNGLRDPRRIRVGQTLKLVRGPFHAVVRKGAHRLDLYASAVDPDGNRLFVRSFNVGLGEYGGTPVGSFVVRRDSKLIDPEWVNPRTGERFAASDPDNPIGERWIGLEGVDARTRDLMGYGIHGTIEPDTIGVDASMGCIRMLPDDVALVYEMLMARVSEVEIVP